MEFTCKVPVEIVFVAILLTRSCLVNDLVMLAVATLILDAESEKVDMVDVLNVIVEISAA